MENKNKKKSTGLLLSILGVISLILITAGVTYAFFSYAKQGVTENTIQTGTITFVYNEKTTTGLNIENALPKSDATGISENASGFQFSVTSTTPSTATIDYIVTARVDTTQSTIPGSQVKLYLTTTGADAGGSGYGVLTTTGTNGLKTFDELDSIDTSTYSNIISASSVANPENEKVIYKGKIAASSSAFTRNFILNMWLAGANEVAAHCEDKTTHETVTTISNETATEANCTGDYTWVAASMNTNGVEDYSAYEFVLKSSIAASGSGTELDPYVYDTTAWKVVDTATTGATDELVKGTDILTSVAYYNGVEGNTLNANDYVRIKYVNQSEGKIYAIPQATATGFSAPTTEGANAVWAESEQYYPLNGKKFVIKVNVYAEGATTYTTPSNG